MNHIKFMEINDQVNFSYPSCLLDSHSQYVPSHTIFNLFCIHVLGGVDESLQVLILFNVCVAIAWAPNVPTKCLRIAKINFKLTIPKGASTQAWTMAFWSFHHLITCTSLEMCAFIFKCGLGNGVLVSQIEGWLGLTFLATRLCTFLRCWANNHFTTYVMEHMLALHTTLIPPWPNLSPLKLYWVFEGFHLFFHPPAKLTIEIETI